MQPQYKWKNNFERANKGFICHPYIHFCNHNSIYFDIKKILWLCKLRLFRHSESTVLVRLDFSSVCRKSGKHSYNVSFPAVRVSEKFTQQLSPLKLNEFLSTSKSLENGIQLMLAQVILPEVTPMRTKSIKFYYKLNVNYFFFHKHEVYSIFA